MPVGPRPSLQILRFLRSWKPFPLDLECFGEVGLGVHWRHLAQHRLQRARSEDWVACVLIAAEKDVRADVEDSEVGSLLFRLPPAMRYRNDIGADPVSEMYAQLKLAMGGLDPGKGTVRNSTRAGRIAMHLDQRLWEKTPQGRKRMAI